MKELVIISGKGGSGKTSVSASFISLVGKCVVTDCDVESPNLHILLNTHPITQNSFTGLPKAYIDKEKCIKCDICTDFCHFSAIRDYQVLEANCEGCTGCSRLCPVDAITMVDHVCGQWFVSQTTYGPMYHARLKPGEQNSGKLVAMLREQARSYAGESRDNIIITDGPPGIGCPTIAALSGTDLAVIVTEPTASAIHDMQRTIELCRHFGIVFGVIINKSNINTDKSQEIIDLCHNQSIPLLGEIPFDPRFRQAINNCQSPVNYSPDLKQLFEPIWHQVRILLQS